MSPGFDWFALYRYIIVIVLFFSAFFFMFSDKSQYTFFITTFILSLFFLWFVLRDLFQSPNYAKLISMPASFDLPQGQDSIFSKVSLTALLIGGIGQLIAMIIILIVFSYAQNQVKNAKSYTITLPSYTHLYNFKICLVMITFLMGCLVFVHAYSNATPDIQRYMRTAITAVTSIGIIGIMAYQMYLSVCVLNVRQKNLLLYNVAE